MFLKKDADTRCIWVEPGLKIFLIRPCVESADPLLDYRYENYSNTGYRRLTITKKSEERKDGGVAARQSVPKPQVQRTYYTGWDYVSGELVAGWN
jgi:hypothetical protein